MVHVDLPEALVVDQILVNMPVKDLMRYRSVCKSWKRRIDSQNFIQKHKSVSKTNPVRSKLLVLTVDDWPGYGVYDVYAVELQNLHVVERLADRPAIAYNRMPRIAGCLDGIVCLWCGYGVLWNPATRERRTLPCSPLRGSYFAAHGFGYDASINTYKLFVMHLFPSNENAVPLLQGFAMECFSAREGNWRELHHMRGMDIRFYEFNRGAYTNGMISWLVYRPGNDPHANLHQILSLDVSTETVQFTALPSGCSRTNNPEGTFTRVDVIRDHIALFSDNVDGDRLKVWILSHRDGRTTWTHLYTADYLLPPWAFDDLCWLNGRRLIFWGERPFWPIVMYDGADRRWAVQGIPIVPYDRLSAALYQESMVRVW